LLLCFLHDHQDRILLRAKTKFDSVSSNYRPVVTPFSFLG
jgi:hypothetical protein